MPKYEYKVIPAPGKGQKARGVKTPEGRFALSVETVLNQMGAEGWEYQRAELLPSDERTGLTGSTTNWRNVLVFRRIAADDLEQFQPRHPDDAAVVVPAPAVAMPVAGNAPRVMTGAPDTDAPAPPVVARLEDDEDLPIGFDDDLPQLSERHKDESQPPADDDFDPNWRERV